MCNSVWHLWLWYGIHFQKSNLQALLWNIIQDVFFFFFRILNLYDMVYDYDAVCTFQKAICKHLFEILFDKKEEEYLIVSKEHLLFANIVKENKFPHRNMTVWELNLLPTWRSRYSVWDPLAKLTSLQVSENMFSQSYPFL